MGTENREYQCGVNYSCTSKNKLIMKNIIFICLLVLLKVPSYSQKDTTIYEWPSGRSAGKIIDGKKTGEWKRYNRTGQLISITDYKEDGTSFSQAFYENGNLSRSCLYDKEGSPIGECMRYNTDGILASSSSQEGSQITYKNYFVSGQLKNIQLYENDTFISRHDYYESGQLYSVLQFYKGKETGEYISYFEDGIIEETGFYSRGKDSWSELLETGEWILYDEKGNIRIICPYKNGERNGVMKCYDCYSYAGERNVITFIPFSNNLENGKSEAFKEDKFYQEGNYRNGLKTGEWKTYLDSGKVEIITYNKSGEPEYFKRFFSSGQLEKKGKYSTGGVMTGIWRMYNQNGKLIWKHNYKILCSKKLR